MIAGDGVDRRAERRERLAHGDKALRFAGVRNIAPDDGKDGPRTQQSFMNFQSDEQLTLDGVIGPTSRARLVTRTDP